MTEKDFELIAGIIRDLSRVTHPAQLSAMQISQIAFEFGRAFQCTNPAFNNSKFIKAACTRAPVKPIGAEGMLGRKL